MEYEESNINSGLILSYIKLLNSIFKTYTNLPSWNTIPTIDEIKSESTLNITYKKILITLSILIKKSNEKKDIELNHLCNYANSLLENKENLNKTTKLNLILCTAIISQKILNEKNKNKYQEFMIEYLQMIMKNFHYAYNNTMYSYYESIANNIAIINHKDLIFDYEYAFLYDREYFDKELIPKLKEESKKLKIFFGEDLLKEFGFDNVDYNNYVTLKKFSLFLEVAKTFEDYKSKHSKDEYIEYKNKLKSQYGNNNELIL